MEDNYTFNVDIETQKSTTSVASLRKEVRELKDQLLNLKQGTEEYNRVLQECANKTHALKEMNEEVRASASDFGERLSNISRVLAGVSGGVQAVTAGLSLMGIEMDKDGELMKTLMSLMSMTQGLLAVADGVKAFVRLTNSIKTSTIAQKGLNAAMKANPIGFILGAVTALAAVIGPLIGKARQAREEAEKLNKTLQDLHETIEANWDLAVHGDANAVKFLEEAKNRQTEIQREIELLKAKGKAESAALQEQIRLQKVERDRAKANADRARELEDSTVAGFTRQIKEATKLRAQYKEGSAEYEACTKQIEEANKDLAQAQEDWKQTYQVEAYWIDQVADSERQLELARIREGKAAAEEADRKRQKAKEDAEEAERKKTWLDILNDMRAALQKTNPELAKFWEGFGDKNKLYTSSADISPEIEKALGVGAITQERAEKFWKAMLDGNEDFLRQYEQQLIKADQEKGTTDPFLLEQEDLERQKKLNAGRIRILQNEIAYYEFTANAEDDYLRQTDLALISATENEQKLLDQQIANSKYNQERAKLEKEYLEDSTKDQKDYGNKAKSFWKDLWEWQYQNQRDSLQKQSELRKAQLTAEKTYQTKLKAEAEKMGDQRTIQAAAERLAEITKELNNLSLDKSKATFKAWGDSITKILGNVTSAMGSLMSYYQTITDEAVADLEDKLEQDLLSQEDYDKQSEELKREQFERNKNFQLAQAYVNGAAGIVQIIGDSSLPSYWAKLAAITSTIATTGIEIATIKAQHYHPSGGGEGGNNNPESGENWINVAPAYQMNDGTDQAQMTGAAVGSQLSSQRVYILESDIQSSNRRVQVRESNTRF